MAGWRSKGNKRSFVFILFAGALLGFAWAAFMAQLALRHALPSAYEGKDVVLVGTVASLPSQGERAVRFQFAVEEAWVNGEIVHDVPPRLALSWYRSRAETAPARHEPVRAGERWQLNVRLKRPHGHANPYGFDYEAWMLEQGLRATGNVRDDRKRLHPNVRRDPFVWGFSHRVNRVRGWLRDHIHAALPNHAYANVLVALVIGEQGVIKREDWNVFTRTGVSHLLSISGLHITMIAGMMGAFISALWRRSFFTRAQWPLHLPAQKVAALSGAITALIYVFLAGFGVPAQRTLYMLLVVAAALWCDRLTRVSSVLLLALGVVVFLDPWAVLWPGFWLSFSAVAIIFFVCVGRSGQEHAGALSGFSYWRHRLGMAARSQYAVTLGLLPLSLLLFGQVSLVSPIANALAIPVVSLLVTPLALIGSVLPMPLATGVLGAAHAILVGLLHLLTGLSLFPWATWTAPIPSLLLFFFALLGTLWMLAPRGWPVRWLGMCCWLPLVVNTASHPVEKQAWVTVFDVGQGSAVLIETQRHRLLYDTGPRYSTESDAGNRLILPYLRGRGIQALDTLVVTHEDSDHAGGAPSILNALAIRDIFSSLPQTAISALMSASPATRHRACHAGQEWEWEGVRFEMLHPERKTLRMPNGKSNARSCVLKVTAGDQAILLTGDIGIQQEAVLIREQGHRLPATILVAPHHGGAKTSSSAFLETVHPDWSVFQAGYRNPYGHPRADVLARHEGQGIRILRTDESGAIRFVLGAQGEIEAYRKMARRYWHHPSGS